MVKKIITKPPPLYEPSEKTSKIYIILPFNYVFIKDGHIKRIIIKVDIIKKDMLFFFLSYRD